MASVEDSGRCSVFVNCYLFWLAGWNSFFKFFFFFFFFWLLALGTFSKMRSTFRLTIGCVLLILMSQVVSIETHVQGQNVDDPELSLHKSIRNPVNRENNLLAFQELLYPSTSSNCNTLPIFHRQQYTT